MMIGPCRHCQRKPICRPRGLCSICYAQPDLRAQYPPGVGYCGTSITSGNFVAGPPDAPTAAPPGSPAKVTVLEQRVAARQSLWHPADAADSDVATVQPLYAGRTPGPRTVRTEAG